MRAIVLLLAGAILHAQTPRADRIIPWLGEVPLMLAPGMLVSIYGSNLGPLEGCRGYGDQQRVDILPPTIPSTSGSGWRSIPRSCATSR